MRAVNAPMVAPLPAFSGVGGNGTMRHCHSNRPCKSSDNTNASQRAGMRKVSLRSPESLMDTLFLVRSKSDQAVLSRIGRHACGAR